jgi:hypothetical protein
MRQRVKQTLPLEERLEQMAEHCRQKAAHLPPGSERDELMRKVRQAETAAHLSELVLSPRLKRQSDRPIDSHGPIESPSVGGQPPSQRNGPA